jgi:hypothetical protein
VSLTPRKSFLWCQWHCWNLTKNVVVDMLMKPTLHYCSDFYSVIDTTAIISMGHYHAEIISAVSLTLLKSFQRFNWQGVTCLHENTTAGKRQKTGRIFKKCGRIFLKLAEFYHKFGRKALLWSGNSASHQWDNTCHLMLYECRLPTANLVSTAFQII